MTSWKTGFRSGRDYLCSEVFGEATQALHLGLSGTCAAAPHRGPPGLPTCLLVSPLGLPVLLPLTLGPLPCRLSWNVLGDEAAAELARVLPQMGRLKRMEYEGHLLGNQKEGRARRGSCILGKAERPLGQAPACKEALTELHTLLQARAGFRSPWVPAFGLPAALLSVGFRWAWGGGHRGKPIPHTHASFSLSLLSAVCREAWRRIGSQLVEPGSWPKGWRKGLASKSFGNKGSQGQGWWVGGHTNLYSVRGLTPCGRGQDPGWGLSEGTCITPPGIRQQAAGIKSQLCHLPVMQLCVRNSTSLLLSFPHL